MSSVEQVEARLGALPRERARGAWIVSPVYDLALFTLAPLLGFALLAGNWSGQAFALFVVGTLLGIPHYLSTFVFYFWDENREYHRAHWMAFFAGPVVITLLFTALLLADFRALPLFILYWWNAFHVARQSCGILSIYRHRAGVRDLAQKRIANTAILAVNGCCALWSIELNPTVLPIFTWISPALPRILWIGSAVIATAALLWLGVALTKRFRSDDPPQLPELAFLAMSLLLFTPYLWVNDWNRAGFGILIGHFVQYLALVWLLHRRRFRSVEGSPAQRALARLSGDTRLLVAAIVGVGALFLVLPRASQMLPWKDAYAWFSGVIIFLHFYCDGLFWAFKRPEVRKSIAPYLLPRTNN